MTLVAATAAAPAAATGVAVHEPTMAEDRERARPRWQPLPNASTPPVPVRNALDLLASTLGLTSVESINALFLDWPTIVGAELAGHCKPRSLRDGQLTITASDRQWATELQWMSSLLIERCCEALGAGAVTSVRVQH